MGMEGKLRRISEFELAAYRKNPAKLYADLFPPSTTTLADFSNLNAAIDRAVNKAKAAGVGQGIRDRVLAGETPLPEEMAFFQGQLQEVLKDFPDVAKVLGDHSPGLARDKRQLSLHKSWSCLHYLFTGKAWETDGTPLGKAIFGGAEIPDVNKLMGCGPVRCLSPTEVRQVSEALERFPIQQKAEGYDPAKAEAEKVYVPDHGAEELTAYFNDLREFYRKAALGGEAVLIWVS